MKKKILLLGSGGHAKSVIDIIESEEKFEIVGIIDNEKEIGDTVLGYTIIGRDDDLERFYGEYKYAFVAVGQIKSFLVRRKLFQLLKNIGYKIPVIISPKAYVSKHASILEGSIIMHQSLVNADAKIGKNCIINSKALIEHDVTIEDNCHISTGAIVNGGVVVKNGTFYGSGATCKEYIEVSGFIKAGSVVK
jgi:sugar O-acyltransferase (sialic acid O-acetyltransferase NeuD family)